MEFDGFTVEPLTPERWDDLVTMLGRGGISGCWCMYWMLPNSQAWSDGAKGGRTAKNKDAFQGLVTEGPPPGLIAYDGDEPVGWCRVMPRARLPGLENSRFFKTDLDTDGVWSLPCFVVRPAHRGRGLTAVLVQAAIAFAREHGGHVLEAYPWKTDEPKSPTTIYTGIASTFERLGFDVVQQKAPHKPMMRYALA